MKEPLMSNNRFYCIENNAMSSIDYCIGDKDEENIKLT